jgi:hypothetical protein
MGPYAAPQRLEQFTPLDSPMEVTSVIELLSTLRLKVWEQRGGRKKDHVDK